KKAKIVARKAQAARAKAPVTRAAQTKVAARAVPISGHTGEETVPASEVPSAPLKYSAAEYSAAPSQPAGPPEPFGMLDLEELPETYGVDECEVLNKDPFWVFAFWEVTEHGIAAAREQLGPSGGGARLVLRLFATVSGPSGADREVQDFDLHERHGRRY